MEDKNSYTSSSVKTEEDRWHPVGVCKRRNNVILCGETKDIQKIMDILDAQNSEHGTKPSDRNPSADEDDSTITPDDFASEDDHSNDPESDVDENSDPVELCSVKHSRTKKSKKK